MVVVSRKGLRYSSGRVEARDKEDTTVEMNGGRSFIPLPYTGFIVSYDKFTSRSLYDDRQTP